MPNVADLFKSVVDRRSVEMVVSGKKLVITEPCAAVARKIFQAEAERTQRLTSVHKSVVDYQERLQKLDTDDAEFADKAASLQAAMVPYLQEIMASTFIADTKPLLLILGDQVTEEWLDNEIGISQLEELSKAVAAVCDPKNQRGVGAA